MRERNPIPGSTPCPHAQTGGCNGHSGPDARSGPHGEEWYDCEECATEAFSNFADNASVLLVLGSAAVMVGGAAVTVAAVGWGLFKEAKRVLRK